MYEATINEEKPLSVELKGDSNWVNGDLKPFDIEKLNEYTFQVTREGRTDTVYILDLNPAEKQVILKINGKKATVAITTELDRLLKSMGLESANSGKVAELKAPMPGLIHSLSVAEGDEIEKGSPLLILEAMKMENVIKSPTEGQVAKIHVEPGVSVEKGQLLISFS